MPSCSALFCPNQQEAGSGRSFHRFPFSRPEILKQWVKNMRRSRDWKPTIRSVVCSDHFEESSLERIGQAVYVKKEAVPTIFQLPSNLSKKPKLWNFPKDVTKKTSSTSASPAVKKRDMDSSATRSLKRSLNREVSPVGNVAKKMNAELPEIKQLKKPFSSLTDIVNDLSKEHLLLQDSAEMLERSFSGVALEMLLMKNKKNGKLTKETYPPILRAFALSLQFYSTKAYDYVYHTFDISLPHPDVISRWYSCCNGQPGFTEEVFAAIKMKVSAAEHAGKEVTCALILDEMSVQKQLEWDGSKLYGLVDLGTNGNDDSMPVAVDALVFMIMALDDSWKLPCGYFMIDGLSGEEKANLVKICLEKLYDAKVKVVSLTCGGPSCSFSTIENLGGNLYIAKPLVPWFPHPSDNTQKVHVMLDTCHMLTLVRNSLVSSPFLLDNENQPIKWSYIAKLYELFENEDCLRSEKLRIAYVNWRKHKLKGNSAAQAFSSSVADSLEFCCTDLKLPQFQDCEPTIRFIRIMIRLFDLLNSRNPLAKNFKAPLSPRNEDVWRPFLKETATYLMELKDYRGYSIYTTKKKAGFIGLLVNIKSAAALYNSLVSSDKPQLQQLLLNKLSLDHLEFLFSAVRARNPHPTCQQFITAYKLLILHQELGSVKKCQLEHEAKIADASSNLCHQMHTAATLDLPLLRKYDLEFMAPSVSKQDCCEFPIVPMLPMYTEECVKYISRYVVLMMEKLIHCTECVRALHAKLPLSHPALTMDNDDLVNPSPSVLCICLKAEQCIKRTLNMSKPEIPQSKEILCAVSASVLLQIQQCHDVFSVLHDHMFDMTPEANHVIMLIKLVTECYVKIRFYCLTLGRQ